MAKPKKPAPRSGVVNADYPSAAPVQSKAGAVVTKSNPSPAPNQARAGAVVDASNPVPAPVQSQAAPQTYTPPQLLGFDASKPTIPYTEEPKSARTRPDDEGTDGTSRTSQTT